MARLALQILDEKGFDVWVYDWGHDALSRLTSHTDGGDFNPVWTPDGRRIVFASLGREGQGLYWRRADGTGTVQRLTEGKGTYHYPASWHPSGKLLAFYEQIPPADYDLMLLPLEGDEVSGWKPGTPSVFLNSPFMEREPVFPPDGRWLAYQANDTGRDEVYVRPFPGPGGKWQVSAGGGATPTWSRKRQELVYRTPDSQRVAAAPADPQSAAKQDRVTFIFDFFDELKRIAPPSRK